MTAAAEPCVFCEIVARRAPAEVLEQTRIVTVIRPLDPVTPGHLLFLPNTHLRDAAEKPVQTAGVFLHAAAWARGEGRPFNLITSAGAEASQSVWHLHVHYVPRAEGDGLHLPWTGQQRVGSASDELADACPWHPAPCDGTDHQDHDPAQPLGEQAAFDARDVLGGRS